MKVGLGRAGMIAAILAMHVGGAMPSPIAKPASRYQASPKEAERKMKAAMAKRERKRAKRRAGR